MSWEKLFAETSQNTEKVIQRNLLQACEKNWETIPKHMKYSEVMIDNCSGRQRLMLASAYLHYLFLSFQAQREICQVTEMTEALVSITQRILSLILTITTHSPEDGLLPRGFSWIVGEFTMLVCSYQKGLQNRFSSMASQVPVC